MLGEERKKRGRLAAATAWLRIIVSVKESYQAVNQGMDLTTEIYIRNALLAGTSHLTVLHGFELFELFFLPARS